MALEVAPYVNALVAVNPLIDDPVKEGSDHLRVIKGALVATFPNLNGAVTATPAALNTTTGMDARVTALENGTVRTSGDNVIVGNLTVTGAIKGAGGYLMPPGGIIAWYGNYLLVPAGWHLCDGTNGTPDLRDRYIIGVSENLAIGALVGSAGLQTVTTTPAGSHNHGGTGAAGGHGHVSYTDGAGSHSHGGSTGYRGLLEAHLPPHTHQVNAVVVVNGGGGIQGGGGLTAGYGSVSTTSVGSGDGHDHPLSPDGSHVHSVAVTPAPDHAHTVPTDGLHTHSVVVDARPPSVALVYIMKL